ncbi:MAG: glutamate--cysteine ligase, partial [Byssovorax sp.]
PGFGAGPPSIGAELEVSLVNAALGPLPRNRAVLAGITDDRVQLELARFNLELNARPVPLAGRPFAALGAQLEDGLAVIGRAARLHGGRVAMIGILPTLAEAALESSLLTNTHRYCALSTALRRCRRGPFHVGIEGEDRLAIASDDVAMEGANTSFQVHLRVPPEEFADAYNAAQIATAPALAAAGNSPLFLGHRLWDETRIALFRQAVDDRFEAAADDWRPARVSFGHGWVREGAFELFAESVALHEPLLPVCGPEDPVACVRAGGVPALDELRLHHGTVWRWNRAVYDAALGGHLRIELRALPSGPTVIDMMANAAFFLGLVLALRHEAKALVRSMTFGHARRNFYMAARSGLDAELLWPTGESPSPRPLPAAELVRRLISTARGGLVEGGVSGAEADHLLAIIEAGVARRQTGASWQRRTLAALEQRLPRAEAIPAMFERYLEATATGRPVHEWPIG